MSKSTPGISCTDTGRSARQTTIHARSPTSSSCSCARAAEATSRSRPAAATSILVSKFPYFCRPIQAERAYDLQEADPEFAYGNKAAARSKFFVWASRIKHNRASIDYFSSSVRQNLEQPVEWARDVINQSFAVDHTLFFKTHCHSMFPYYREAKRVPVFPHAHPGVQTVFSLVFDAAASAGVEIEFATVSEVYERFVAAAYVPANGYALKIAGPAPKLQHPASTEAGRVRRQPSITLDLGPRTGGASTHVRPKVLRLQHLGAIA